MVVLGAAIAGIGPRLTKPAANRTEPATAAAVRFGVATPGAAAAGAEAAGAVAAGAVAAGTAAAGPFDHAAA
jgi:hypothetical protein